MLRFKRTDAKHPDFISLVNALDADLAIRDGDDHAFYHQFNKIEAIKYALVVYDDGQAIACGAIKEFKPRLAEVKRMYTLPAARNKGVATKILVQLEKWAAHLKFKKLILETGKKQPEAIALYKKYGFKLIANYGQYKNIENSLCFEKNLPLSTK